MRMTPVDRIDCSVRPAGMPFAFNPSFDEIKIEDTFLTTTIGGRKRRLWLEATT